MGGGGALMQGLESVGEVVLGRGGRVGSAVIISTLSTSAPRTQLGGV